MDSTGNIVSSALKLVQYKNEVFNIINNHKCPDNLAKRLIVRTVTGKAKQVLCQLVNSGNNCDYKYLFNIP